MDTGAKWTRKVTDTQRRRQKLVLGPKSTKTRKLAMHVSAQRPQRHRPTPTAPAKAFVSWKPSPPGPATPPRPSPGRPEAAVDALSPAKVEGRRVRPCLQRRPPAGWGSKAGVGGSGRSPAARTPAQSETRTYLEACATAASALSAWRPSHRPSGRRFSQSGAARPPVPARGWAHHRLLSAQWRIGLAAGDLGSVAKVRASPGAVPAPRPLAGPAPRVPP